MPYGYSVRKNRGGPAVASGYSTKKGRVTFHVEAKTAAAAKAKAKRVGRLRTMFEHMRNHY